METTSSVLVMAIFGLVIYLVATMPTKRDIKRLLEGDTQGARLRRREMRSMLEDRLNRICTVTLDDPVPSLSESMVLLGGNRVAGMVIDVDDEWVLMDVPAKKGGPVRHAIRLECIAGIEAD